MTKDEAETGLDNRLQAYRNGTGNLDDYKAFWREVGRAGFKIRRGWISGKLVHSVSLKKRGLAAKWLELNTNPAGKLIGDCTTRALAYIFPSSTYAQLQGEQRKQAALYYGTPSAWKRIGSWQRVAEARDYAFLNLRRPMTRARVAVALAGLERPVLTRSSGHVAAIDKGQVVDTWDSRNGRVNVVGCWRPEISKAKALLGGQLWDTKMI